MFVTFPDLMVYVMFALCNSDFVTHCIVHVYRMLLLLNQRSMTAVLLQWSEHHASE